MKLTVQKRLAAGILKCSESKVAFDDQRIDEIKEAITKNDIRKLIKDYAIIRKKENGPSRVRANKTRTQKIKGRRKGSGSRKGRESARTEPKREWINRVRKQKAFLKGLRDNKRIETKDYRVLYLKAKGGFFRSLRHIKMFITDQKIIKKE